MEYIYNFSLLYFHQVLEEQPKLYPKEHEHTLLLKAVLTLDLYLNIAIHIQCQYGNKRENWELTNLVVL